MINFASCIASRGISLTPMNYFLFAGLYFFSCLFATAEAYTVFEEGGKYGLKNQEGVVLIPAVYESLGWSDGNFSVQNQVTGYRLGEYWGLISLGNQTVTPAEYFSLYPGSPTLIIATKRSPLTLRITAGCIDTAGKVIIPFSYSGLKIHSLRAITFTLDGNQLKYGLIDLTNKLILPQIYQNIYPVGSLRYAVQNFNNKTALFTENGKQVTDFLIDSISQVNQGPAIIYQNGRLGLIDREGQIVRKPIYREIIIKDNRHQVRLPDEWHLLDISNTLVQKIEADSIVQISNTRLKVVTANGTQLTDMNLNEVGEEKQIKQIQSFHNTLAVFIKNEKAGVIRSDGSILLPAIFEQIQVDNGFIIAYSYEEGRKICTLYDRLGQKKTTKFYDSILKFNGSIFRVVNNSFFGAIDTRGSEIIACSYDSLLESKGDLVVVKFRGQYGVITVDEQWIVLPQPNPIRLISNERYFEKVDSTTFLKSIDGTTLYFTTNKIQTQGANLVEYVSDGGKWTINLSGQIIHRELPSKEQTDKIFASSEGFRGIIRNGKYGFIDDLGRLRIANRYEDSMPFSEGLAAIKIIGKWGFINKDDNIVVQPSFDEVTPFENGKAKGKQNGKYGIINTEGKTLVDFRYDEIRILENNRAQVTLGRLVGLADSAGDLLLQPKYESIEDLGNGYVIVKQHEKFGVVSLNGISTIPSHYDYLTFDPTKNIFLGLKKSLFTELNVK